MTVCYWHKLDMSRQITLVINSSLFLSKNHIVLFIIMNHWLDFISSCTQCPQRSPGFFSFPPPKQKPYAQSKVFRVVCLSVIDPILLPLKNYSSLYLLKGKQIYPWRFGKKKSPSAFHWPHSIIIVLCTEHLTSLLSCF